MEPGGSRKRPAISVLMRTASADSFLQSSGIASYFRAFSRNLARQTFSDFELVYVDLHHAENAVLFRGEAATLPFAVKHVGLHTNHRYWYDRGHLALSASKNTGILHADGELCITFDDAEFLPDDLLARYWQYWQNDNALLLATHRRLSSIDVADGLPTFPISGDAYISDRRLVGQPDIPARHCNGGWAFAGTSFPLATALAINGFNERMDGQKTCEDCEFGVRLAMAGHEFVTTRADFLYIVDHDGYSPDAITVGVDGQASPQAVYADAGRPLTAFYAIENSALLTTTIKLLDLKANSGPITTSHLNIIRQKTMASRGFDPLAIDHSEKFKVWMETPTFDLHEEWLAMRG